MGLYVIIFYPKLVQGTLSGDVSSAQHAAVPDPLTRNTL